MGGRPWLEFRIHELLGAASIEARILIAEALVAFGGLFVVLDDGLWRLQDQYRFADHKLFGFFGGHRQAGGVDRRRVANGEEPRSADR